MDSLHKVKQRIAQACAQAGRPVQSVQLLAVSKGQNAQAIAEAHAAGQNAFGENYLQEALAKIAALEHLPLQWHFIGALQSNKTAAVAAHFAWVHSVNSLKLAQRLSAQRPAHLTPLQLCLQVNIDHAPTKAGLPPDLNILLPLAQAVIALPHVQLRGLMVIPEPREGFEAQRVVFQQAADLLKALKVALVPTKESKPCLDSLDTLSMGMSADLEAAIAAGSTCVRVGTAVFGERQTQSKTNRLLNLSQPRTVYGNGTAAEIDGFINSLRSDGPLV
jgi:pyridoxal phosphate enzyme (YggS family)